MDPWGTPALTEYSCGDFPFKTTRSHLLLRKEEIRLNIWPEISYDLIFRRRPAWQILSKAFDISGATAQVALNLLKAFHFLSDTTVRRSKEDREDLKLYWKLEKRPQNNDWVFVCELSGCAFKSHGCDLYLDCFRYFRLH